MTCSADVIGRKTECQTCIDNNTRNSIFETYDAFNNHIKRHIKNPNQNLVKHLFQEKLYNDKVFSYIFTFGKYKYYRFLEINYNELKSYMKYMNKITVDDPIEVTELFSEYQFLTG